MKKALAFFSLTSITVLILVGSAYLMPASTEIVQMETVSDASIAAGFTTQDLLNEKQPEAAVEKGEEMVQPETTPIKTTEPGKQLTETPTEIKAIYATGWSAGSASRVDYLKKIINETEANAIVIDLKDYAGIISYKTGDPRISMYGGEEQRIRDIRKLVKDLHDNGIYVIGRITVFQDPILAQKRPDIAIKDKDGNLWGDNKKIYWIDPSAKDAWDYNINLAKNAYEAGFDEINFDYVRYPTDGNLGAAIYPMTDFKTTTKAAAIKSFFKYTREALPDKVLSADLFGLTTINKDDLGIGQVIENAFIYFDYVAPMVYPSHYAAGFIGYENPAEYPYEVVKYSLITAENRLQVMKTKDPSIKAKIRPWLQDFNMGATYDADKVKSQIKASADSGSVGWMLWSPKNIYTKEAILTKSNEIISQAKSE